MLSPRGYPPGYAVMIFSHRLLRYLTPFLHLLALRANIALLALGAGALYEVTLALQLALLLGALLGGGAARPPAADRPLLRAHDRLARGRAVGLAAPRRPGAANGKLPRGTR